MDRRSCGDCPGRAYWILAVSICDGVVIGAGSVVTKDIPANVVAVGNPCRVVRPVTEKDREVWDTGENGEGPLSQGPKANSPG